VRTFLKESYDLFNEKVADLDFDNPPIEFHNKLASFGGFIIQFYRENEYLIRNINYFDRLIEQFEKQLADLSEKVEKKKLFLTKNKLHIDGIRLQNLHEMK